MVNFCPIINGNFNVVFENEIRPKLYTRYVLVTGSHGDVLMTVRPQYVFITVSWRRKSDQSHKYVLVTGSHGDVLMTVRPQYVFIIVSWRRQYW